MLVHVLRVEKLVTRTQGPAIHDIPTLCIWEKEHDDDEG